MANRSYLYTTDHLPESPEWDEQRDLHSIAEWNYDIPLAFKLLLTGNPIAVKSSIWETPERIAIAGEFKSGLNVLQEYLARLPSEAEPLVTEANEFLLKASNERKYFILECGEIFDMDEGSLEDRNLSLLQEISSLKPDISKLHVPIAPKIELPKLSLIDRLFGKKQEQEKSDPLEPFYGIGLGNWSNILYFQFGEE
ncbi:Uncharacterised protein [BD1-7 clade bacterium]|uniref:DUF7822 domain-containing protein n=1 Tax=BD1-7 clade bacterium TaxID=2029982 RepID=A0A5S9PJ38_9GAMM|nr:Uncharacterised protein [BD1-7 clade bacterium]CAA0104256.1 Uncharacterised protein [BD1-7 clade bacterium]